jgi:hypothetical protein
MSYILDHVTLISGELSFLFLMLHVALHFACTCDCNCDLLAIADMFALALLYLCDEFDLACLRHALDRAQTLVYCVQKRVNA